MATFFLVVALWPVLDGPLSAVRWWALGGALGFLVVALVRPALLAPLNRLWTRLGLLLFRVVGPLFLGIIFYATVTPIGLAMRLIGKEPLQLRRQGAADSYWIVRDPPGPPPDSMKNQF